MKPLTYTLICLLIILGMFYAKKAADLRYEIKLADFYQGLYFEQKAVTESILKRRGR